MNFNFVNHCVAPNQPVVLFLHGFLGNCAEFNSIIAHLDHYHCIAIDLPGHGKTQFSSEYSLPKIAIAIVAWLDQLQIEQANLVGYSMGGRIALYLALNYPERFPKAVIESGSPGLKTESERSQRRQRDCELADRLEANFDQFLTDWYNMPLFKTLTAHLHFPRLREERIQNNPVELARSLREMGTGMQPSLWQELASHRQPLLLMVGQCDHKFIAINQEMASRCRTAELAIIPGCGHNIHFEKPAAFLDQLQRFL